MSKTENEKNNLKYLDKWSVIEPVQKWPVKFEINVWMSFNIIIEYKILVSSWDI